MSKPVEVNYSGFGVMSLLGVLFVGLKLTGHIDWSWWFVLMPFYLGWAILFGVALAMIVVGAIACGVVALFDRVSK